MRFSLDFQGLALNTFHMAQVVLDHLTKVFQGPGGEPIRAVDVAALVVGDKELLVLVGPSGCGKTTTLRLIAGLEGPTTGTIAINGQVVNSQPPKDRDVALVFQHYALYPHMSAYDNMAFGLTLRHYPKAEIDQRVRDAARVLDLAACLDRKPSALSGGQRQRVALGRAIVRQPKLFLLDEPLSNLDAPSRLQMRTEIARLQARLGVTMIYVTHDQVEALTLGQRVAVMNQGVIQQVADPMTLYRQPANLFVAGFIGSPPMNFLHGTLRQRGPTLVFQEAVRNAAATTAPISLELEAASAAPLRSYIGKPLVFGIRPEHVICGPKQPDSPAAGALQAVIELVQPMGSETYLHLAGHAGSIVARVPANHPASPGQAISLGFDLRQAHCFDPASGTALV